MANTGLPDPGPSPQAPLCGPHMGVVLCWNIYLCLLVSINPDRFLTLANIALWFS